MGEEDNLTEANEGNEHSEPQLSGSNLISKEIGLFFERLGKKRDGFLVTLAVIYGAGYLVWAVTSRLNNLGLLPALDFQYFIAGIIPVAILSAGLLIGRFLQWFLLNYWPEHVGPEASGVWLTIRQLTIYGLIGTFLIFTSGLIGIFWGLVGLILAQVWKRYAPGDQSFSGVKSIALILVMLLFLAGFLYTLNNQDEINEAIFGPYSERIRSIIPFLAIMFVILIPPGYDGFFSWLSKAYRWFFLWVLIPILCLIGLLFYAETVYPILPQELGGVRPRCAFFDVAQDEFSSETNQDILLGGQTSPTDSVVRTVQLDVLYSNSSALIIKPYSIDEETRGPIYEIQRDAVQSIYWCD